MSWQLAESLEWCDPLVLARDYADHDMALFYSGLRERFTGINSYLLLDPCEEISGTDWSKLPPLPARGEPLPLWVGYLGYGMRELAERGDPSPIALADFRLVRYGMLYHFDHRKQLVNRYLSSETVSGGSSDYNAKFDAKNNPTAQKLVTTAHVHKDYSLATRLASNFTRAEYETIVTKTINEIRAGNFYQANITRKFFGEFEQIPDSFALFERLITASPAPYSAYIRHNDTAILSSSPECFLSINTQGHITTRPIKGSARRSSDANEDAHIQETLRSSAKNLAENLMIVDLMRNDLSRVSEPHSVTVTEQSALYSYETIHHLISTIEAKKRPKINVYEAVRACFPAGSMTGAPKIAAMQWCAQQEKLERGVYSGAIGWFGARDTCDLSVVIRTLIVKGNQFEFQVGGGIVADSDPEDEWRETIAKARGILAALGVEEAALMAL